METKKLSQSILIYNQDEIPAQYTPLIKKAKLAVQNAYAPYSQFQVGAAVLLKSGEIICGNNQENASYPTGLCAERTAIFYANANYPQKPVIAIAIAAYKNGNYLQFPIAPCGSCRQVLLETEKRFKTNIHIILWGTEKTFVIKKAADLLPLSFSNNSLE